MQTSESKSVADATDNTLRHISPTLRDSLVAPNETIMKHSVA
jgi:hypothetical protein